MGDEERFKEQKSVLIVEDDAILAVHLLKTLVGLGYRVPEPVDTGEAAIAAVAAERPDLVLMDIQLAGELDGITTAERIIPAADVPIVFLTAYSQSPLLQRAIATVSYGYLLKPVSQQELEVVIKMAFYKHTLDRQLKARKAALQKGHDELEWRVQERTADLLSANESLRREMEERGRVEAALQKSNRLLEALSQVQSYYISGLSTQDLFKMILDVFCELTDSKIGFIDKLQQTPAGEGYLKIFSVTNSTWNDEPCKLSEGNSLQDLEFHNLQTLFGAVLKTGKAVIANDPAADPRCGGVPEGHPPLDAFLGLPIHSGTQLVGMVGLANRSGGYDDKIAEYLEPLLLTCGNIIEADRNKQRRKAAEQRLSESEERYRRIAEGLTDYLYRVQVQDGKVMGTIHGPTCEVVTGYTPAEYAADPCLWVRMIVVEDRDSVTDHIKRTLAGEVVPPVEHRILHKDGQIRWVSSKFISQFDPQGTLVAYDGVLKDITERKRSEEQIFNSRASLVMAIDAISDPLLMLDAELRIKRLNKAARDYFGATISYEDVIGKLCFEVRGNSNPCEGCECPLSELRGYSGSFERKKGTGSERIEQVFVDVVKNKWGKPEAFVIRINDITRARMMERQFIQGEKLASLGLLVAGIAHEINNPNNFIFFNLPILRSYLQFLLPIIDEYVLVHPELLFFNRPYAVFREDCFKLLANIEHGSTRINQIVGNLREFVRERGRGEKSLIDLKQVVGKAVSICAARVKKAVTIFEINIPEGLPALYTDPLALEQIVVNLLINAAQAADKDDSWVKLKIIRSPEPEAEVIVEVSDNGCGMDTETQRRIFDPFFTTKPADIGTGLGLSICHRLVAELGGRIDVKSEEGKGSIFRLIFKETAS